MLGDLLKGEMQCLEIRLSFQLYSVLQPSSDPYAFTLTDDIKGVDIALLGTAVLQSQTCTSDYILIPTPYQVANGVRTALSSDRFCGLGIGQIYSESFKVINGSY